MTEKSNCSALIAVKREDGHFEVDSDLRPLHFKVPHNSQGLSTGLHFIPYPINSPCSRMCFPLLMNVHSIFVFCLIMTTSLTTLIGFLLHLLIFKIVFLTRQWAAWGKILWDFTFFPFRIPNGNILPGRKLVYFMGGRGAGLAFLPCFPWQTTIIIHGCSYQT